MSQNSPMKHQPRNGFRPDFKIRPGFTDDELAEFHAFLSKFPHEGQGPFTKRVILDEIRKRPRDQPEESEK